MPWTQRDAKSKTSKANTPKLRRMWKAIANSALARGKSDGAAIRMANGKVRDASVLKG